MTIDELRDAFVEDARHRLRLRPATLRAYRYDLRLAATALPHPLDAITLRQVEDYLAEQAQATATRRAASLRRFFR